jgi:transposase
MQMQSTIDIDPVIYLAIELSASTWLVAGKLPTSEKTGLHRLEAGNSRALLALIADLREKVDVKFGVEAAVVSCFEAGRDGFWLHRLLAEHGVSNHVAEPTSILVNRRARRAKTNRLDAQGLLRILAAHAKGDHEVCSIVRVPTIEEEDAKRPHREREHLIQERVRVENRIAALLTTQGIQKRPSLRSWEKDMEEMRTGDGRPIPPLHARARKTLIQLAWLWLRYQPDSGLACWFRERVGNLQGRTRRIAIVAMARKLLIAIWRYATTGIVPEGAQISI